MKIIHISDVHDAYHHVEVPECDVVIFTGDISHRTKLSDLTKFLVWFENLPAKKKIMIAGNHDICLDKKWIKTEEEKGSIEGLLAKQKYYDAKSLLDNYKIKYLENTEYVYEGVKFYGSPYSPSFHRERWVFNADRGQEIRNIWGKIPHDTDILLTHSPAFGILDEVPIHDRMEWHKDGHVGCEDLMDIIVNKLHKLKLHCFGHIHDNSGIVIKKVSNRRSVIFSNGACVGNSGEIVISKPFVINI